MSDGGTLFWITTGLLIGEGMVGPYAVAVWTVVVVALGWLISHHPAVIAHRSGV